MRRVDFAALALVLLVVTGCSGAPASSPASVSSPAASAASSAAPSGAAPTPAASFAELQMTLTFSADDGAAAEGTVTLEAGGAISATAVDGTVYELVVPAGAVPADTVITLTPLTDIDGMGDGPAHAVQLEPDGLELFDYARLTITPAGDIELESQLMFEATGSGTDAHVALVDPESEQIVLLLEHFSIGGVGSASAEQRAAFLVKSATNAERRISDQIRARIQAERIAQLLGSDELTEFDLSDLTDEYKREVVDKLREAATLSCRHLLRYLRTAISFERQLQLLGTSEADEQASLARVAEAVEFAGTRYVQCEREAIAECREKGDPSILVRFWLANERPADQARAESLCLESDFRIDKTVSVTELNVSVSITYSGVKCGGPGGEWVIDSSGTLEGYGGTAEIGGPVVVQIDPETLQGTVDGTANFSAETTGQTQGRFTGTARFVEDPATLELTITSGGGNGYQFGFLDTGFTGPGTLTLPLEEGQFCDD